MHTSTSPDIDFVSNFNDPAENHYSIRIRYNRYPVSSGFGISCKQDSVKLGKRNRYNRKTGKAFIDGYRIDCEMFQRRQQFWDITGKLRNAYSSKLSALLQISTSIAIRVGHRAQLISFPDCVKSKMLGL